MDVRELRAGALAGALGQLAGHPLDTVKVRMQTDAGGVRDAGAWRCATRTFAEGGARSFFRGLSVPLLSKSVEQCIAFGARGAADRALEASGWRPGRARAGAAGAAAGAATAALLTPVYLIKVQLQVTAREGLHGPTVAICRAVVANGPLGLYAGASPIMLGTTVGYACRFACYDKAVESVRCWGASGTLATILGGGVAGMATWASHYPLDLLSARMQAAALERGGGRRLSMLGHLKEVLSEHGPRGLFRGLAPCLVRAFPVNAVIFLTYEAAMGT